MSANHRRSFRVAALAGLLLAAAVIGCQSRAGVGPLPGPEAGPITFSRTQPANAFTSLAPGILTRTVYSAGSGAGYRVEVRDLLVGPGQKASAVSLPGGAVIEVRSGQGVITVAGQRRELRIGATLTLSQDQAFDVENTGGGGLAIRVHLLSGT